MSVVSAWVAAVVPFSARVTVSVLEALSVMSICSDSTRMVWPMAKSVPAVTTTAVSVAEMPPASLMLEPESSLSSRKPKRPASSKLAWPAGKVGLEPSLSLLTWRRE